MTSICTPKLAVTASNVPSRLERPDFSGDEDFASSPPFTPRTLTRSERRRGDLYMYVSPKLSGRRVDLLGCATMALALQFEFDAEVATYVERPRTLSINDGHVELHFWTRLSHRRECFWLLVPVEDTHKPHTPHQEHRHACALLEAARAAHIVLQFIFEDELRQRAAMTGTWYRLLPYVQTAHTLPNRYALTESVVSLFRTQARATFDQIEGNLRGFDGADVRAVVCDLIHGGQLELTEPSHLSRFSVVQRRGTL
jgi:hypothetical protein